MQSAVLAMIDSICLTVCHTMASYQNDSSYTIIPFIRPSLEDSSITFLAV